MQAENPHPWQDTAEMGVAAGATFALSITLLVMAAGLLLRAIVHQLTKGV